jgi:hypothetical protein
MFVFIAHGWWLLGGICAFMGVVNMINGYDIYLNNRADEEGDPEEIKRRAAYFMSLKEEDKKRYYEQMDKKAEKEFEPKK